MKHNKTKKMFILILLILITTLSLSYILISSFKTSEIEENNDSDIAKSISDTKNKKKKITNKSYAISTSTEQATEIGKEILEHGGNAVDAAVAVSYALGLTEPYGSGIGGGGGMLIYSPDADSYYGIDYRDMAPYSSDIYDINQMGIPGFVKGMELANKEFGTISMSELIEPSIQLGESGIEVSKIFARFINNYSNILESNTDYQKDDGTLLKQGDVFRPKKLIETMRKIQLEGASEFYEGSIGEKLVANTWLTESDLKDVRVEIIEPVVTKIANNEYATLPPPFSGVTLLQMLKMANMFEMPDPDTDPDNYLEAYKQIKNIAYNNRLSTIGDPNFFTINASLLVEDNYIEEILRNNNNKYLKEEEFESSNTTHFTIIDDQGMTVSATNTLGYFYGSGVEVEGVYLNSAMRSFSKGKTGINTYEAGKKPRNFTAPVIINTDKRETIAIGTPGGNMIPEFMFQVIYDHFYKETSWEEAVGKNRLNLMTNQTFIIEKNKQRPDFVKPQNISYQIKISDDYFGSIQIVCRDSEGNVSGVYDSRREGLYEGVSK